MKLVVNNTHRPVAIPHEYPDYPIGIRFVPHDPAPKTWTTDELIWLCFFSGFAGCMGTAALAVLWSFL